jgi:hypothetical protein
LTSVIRVTLLALQQRHSTEALSAVTWLSELLALRILKNTLMPPWEHRISTARVF